MSFFSSLILTVILLWNLRKLKIQQIERLEGPDSHKSKSGTPTMGGIGFVLVVFLYSLLMVDYKYLPVVLLFLGFSLIGFVDDFIKVFLSRNLGLTFWQKIVSQAIFAAGFMFYVIYFTSHWQNAGIFGLAGLPLYFLLSIFLMVVTANATNLTDGLDGLLGGTSIIAFVAMFLLCIKQDLFGGAAFSFVMIGALMGFIVFNFPKARIFMGDTGSLGIGAAISGLAIVIHRELALAVVGGLFLVEALSVIIQVAGFKLWKIRIFKMAPIHHHFELSGMTELQGVILFWSAQILLGIIGVMIL